MLKFQLITKVKIKEENLDSKKDKEFTSLSFF